MSDCKSYVSEEDIKALKESELHIEHVARSRNLAGEKVLSVTDTIRGEKVTNRTLDGLEELYQNALSNIGYQQMGDYKPDITIDGRNQIVFENGSWYIYRGDLPHVTTGATLTEDGGIWSEENPNGQWVDVGQQSLREELKKYLSTQKLEADSVTVHNDNMEFNSNKLTVSEHDVFVNNIRIGHRIGDIYFSPFPSFELDFGEFEANGMMFDINSEVGNKLKNLSFAYRMAWGIVENNGYINLPNMYDRDGFGLYMRAGNVGDGHEDAVETITGQFSVRTFGTSGNAPLFHDREGAFSAESSNFTGAQVTPITSTASEKKSSQKIWFQSNNSSKGGAETRVRTRSMTPVIFLGVDSLVVDKDLMIETTDNVPVVTQVYNAGFQANNLTQSSIIRYGSVYSLHPYYEDSVEKGIVIGNHLINDDKVTLITKTDKLRHQGLALVGIQGERYFLSSANDSGSIDKSTHIGYFKENDIGNVHFRQVFSKVGSGMVSPSVSEDGEYLVVVQYDKEEQYITVRMIKLLELIINNELIVVSEFTINHPYVKGVDVFQSVATDKKYIYVLFGGLRSTDRNTVRKYNINGELIRTYVINAGKKESEEEHQGYIEPETLFFLNNELFYMPVLGPTGKRFTPIYKIGVRQ